MAYMAIPVVLLGVIVKRRDLPFRPLVWWFGAFILGCGATHLMDVLVTVKPMYRLDIMLRIFTGIVSWGTVVALVRSRSRIMSMKSPDELERQVAERTRELLEINARKDEFLAILGHELRNPLAAIRNAINIVELGGDEQKRAALAVLRNQCEHITGLVDDIITVSRATRGVIELNKHDVPVSEVIERATEIAEPLITKYRHNLQVHAPCNDSMVVLGDKIRLVQMISNLLTNSAKYTKPGGNIEIHCEREGPFAKIKVADNGIGIEKTDLSSIFELCVRTERARQKENGLGIGLTMAKAVIDLHGGTIEVFSEGADKGAAFTIRIPIKEDYHACSAS